MKNFPFNIKTSLFYLLIVCIFIMILFLEFYFSEPLSCMPPHGIPSQSPDWDLSTNIVDSDWTVRFRNCGVRYSVHRTVVQDGYQLRSVFNFKQILEVGQHGKPVNFNIGASTLFEALTSFNSNIQSGMFNGGRGNINSAIDPLFFYSPIFTLLGVYYRYMYYLSNVGLLLTIMAFAHLLLNFIMRVHLYIDNYFIKKTFIFIVTISVISSLYFIISQFLL